MAENSGSVMEETGSGWQSVNEDCRAYEQSASNNTVYRLSENKPAAELQTSRKGMLAPLFEKDLDKELSKLFAKLSLKEKEGVDDAQIEELSKLFAKVSLKEKEGVDDAQIEELSKLFAKLSLKEKEGVDDAQIEDLSKLFAKLSLKEKEGVYDAQIEELIKLFAKVSLKEKEGVDDAHIEGTETVLSKLFAKLSLEEKEGDDAQMEQEVVMPGSSMQITAPNGTTVTLTTQSAATLDSPNWIDNVAIDAFSAVLVRERTTEPCIFIARAETEERWRDGTYDRFLCEEMMLSRYNYYKYVMAPININQCHWVLLVCNVEERTMTILDSMGGDTQLHLKLDSNGHVTVERVPNMSVQQTDNHSCGVIVMLNAYAIVKGVPLHEVRPGHIPQMRNFVKRKILSVAGFPLDQ